MKAQGRRNRMISKRMMKCSTVLHGGVCPLGHLRHFDDALLLLFRDRPSPWLLSQSADRTATQRPSVKKQLRQT